MFLKDKSNLKFIFKKFKCNLEHCFNYEHELKLIKLYDKYLKNSEANKINCESYAGRV